MYDRNRTSSSLSRRQLLNRCIAVGVSLAGRGPLLDGLLAEDQSPPPSEPQRRPYPSHAPDVFFKGDSKAVIERMIMPRPKGRMLTDDILSSSGIENVFYLRMGERAVLIDTGFDFQIGHHLANLEGLGGDLSKIVAILATHSHVDHTAGLKKARDRLGVPVVAHQNAIPPITRGDLLRTAAIIPEVDGWKFDYPACPIDETVDQGDTILIGDERIEVHHIPGHTPDCVGYLWRGHFFTGDAVFGGGLVGWASQQWLSNYSDHAESMLRLISDKLDADKFHAAHGPELPYSSQVPEACLKTLKRLLAAEADPCNHTPRTRRRPADSAPRVLKLPA